MNSTISTVLFKVLGERHETHSKMLRLFPAAQVPAPAADFKELPRLRAAEGDETVGKLSGSGKHRDRSRSLGAGVGDGAGAGRARRGPSSQRPALTVFAPLRLPASHNRTVPRLGRVGRSTIIKQMRAGT